MLRNNEMHAVVLDVSILVAPCRVPRLRALYLASGDMQRYLTLLQVATLSKLFLWTTRASYFT